MNAYIGIYIYIRAIPYTVNYVDKINIVPTLSFLYNKMLVISYFFYKLKNMVFDYKKFTNNFGKNNFVYKIFLLKYLYFS